MEWNTVEKPESYACFGHLFHDKAGTAEQVGRDSFFNDFGNNVWPCGIKFKITPI